MVNRRASVHTGNARHGTAQMAAKRSPQAFQYGNRLGGANISKSTGDRWLKPDIGAVASAWQAA